MSTNNYYLSFCIPVYNEEKIIFSKIIEIQKTLKKILNNKYFEILIVENGSTDNTLKQLRTIKDKNVHVISLEKKGHGLAMKTAILNSNSEFALLTAIDLPFGFSDLEAMLKIANKYDLIFGSKANPKSVIHSSLLRKSSSRIYRFLLKLLFNVKIGDTQGTVFLNRETLIPLLKYCDAANAFFSAQLAIFAQKQGLKMTEVPVVMTKDFLRKSKYNIIKDGKIMVTSMLNTYIKIRLV
jgi:glycosyltransferase involved in cell wall biosynthesis